MQICSVSSQRPIWPARAATSIAVIGVALLVIGALGALKVFSVNSLSPYLADKHFFIAGGALFAGSAFALFLHYTCCCFPQKKIKDPAAKLKNTNPPGEDTGRQPELQASSSEGESRIPTVQKKKKKQSALPGQSPEIAPDPKPSPVEKMTQEELENALAMLKGEKNKEELSPILINLPKEQAEALIKLITAEGEALSEETIEMALKNIPDDVIDKAQVSGALKRIARVEAAILTDAFTKIGSKSKKKRAVQQSHIRETLGASATQQKKNPKLEPDFI